MGRSNVSEWRRWGLAKLRALKVRREDVTIEMSDFELGLIIELEKNLGPSAESIVGAYPKDEILGALLGVGGKPPYAKEMSKAELYDWMDEYLDDWQLGTARDLLIAKLGER